MKTSELVSKLTSMGYQVKVNLMMRGVAMFVYTPEGKCAGYVCTNVFGALSTDTRFITSGKAGYDQFGINNLVEYLTSYALTPLDEREDTKEYLVKLLPKGDNYLNQDKADKHIFSSSADETNESKTRFTEKEYNELQSKYLQWLPKFDKDDHHFFEVQQDEYEEW